MAAVDLYCKDPESYRQGITPYLLARKHFYSEDKWNRLVEALRTTRTL